MEALRNEARRGIKREAPYKFFNKKPSAMTGSTCLDWLQVRTRQYRFIFNLKNNYAVTIVPLGVRGRGKRVLP
ncbi:MAG: hypothetical protein HC903_31590 [Methylacidiphilales bacterium]|nr:hypothetical protein [Candidatus Methylacidiphilales bacterium]NJR15292.1 hypothetical protein [Calothrix sp. CSU_2_0]